jgi:hypothetical protein
MPDLLGQSHPLLAPLLRLVRIAQCPESLREQGKIEDPVRKPAAGREEGHVGAIEAQAML